MAVTRLTRLRPIAFSESASTRRRKGPGSRHLSMTGWPDFSPPERTAQQLFELAMAKNMERHSFMDKLKHGASVAFSPVEWTMDKLMRTNYAVASAYSEALKHRGEGLSALDDVAGEAYKGLRGKRHTTFSTVLDEAGVLKGHRRLRGVAGLGLDIVADPLTYVTAGTAPIAAKGSAKAGEEVLAHAAGRRAIEGGFKGKSIEGTVSHKIQWAHDIKRLTAAGENYKWRKALAVERARHKSLKTITEGDRAQLSLAREAALREEKAVSRRLPFIKFMGKQITPTTIGGKQVVPHLPRVINTLEKANIPILSKTIGNIRGAVGAGKTDVIRGVRVGTKHTMEELSGKYIEHIQEGLKHMPKKLSKERSLRALAHFERKGGVEKQVLKSGKVKYVINEKRVQKLLKDGELSHEEIDFVRGWHNIAEFFNKTDKAFGVTYEHMGEKGKLYVPHLMDRVGQPYTSAQKTLLKKQGYTKGRKNTNLTLEHIASLVKEGKLPRDIETDPYKMLVSMARTRAHQHADKAAVDFLARGVGVQKRIVDAPAQRRIKRLEKEHNELTAKLLKYDTPSKRNLKQYKTMKKKAGELDNEIKKLYRGKKNKEARKDMVELEQLRDEFGNKVVVEPEIAEALKRVEKIVDPTEDITVSKFARGWASMVGRWKLLVTAVNPGYRIRNTLSDFWNMYVAGVPTWAFGRYGARAAHVMRMAKKGDEKSIRILSDAYKAGILSGLYGGDIDTIAHMLKYAGSKRSLAHRGRIVKLGSKVAQDVNRNGENWGRLVHYLYRREHQGMSIADSAWEVKKAHFDYEDLTEFERKHLKGKLFPFYTWTRKNVPYQIQAIVTHPGKYAVFPKTVTESEIAAGGGEGDVLPDYMTHNFAFKVPFGKHTYTTPQLGMGDLSRFFEGRNNAVRNTMAMLNPAFKIPAEVALNKSFYTGQEIDPATGHPRQPISDWAAPLMKLIPGSNVGQTKRGDAVGMGASPWLAYAFGQSPWTRQLFLNGRIKHSQQGYAGWYSQLGGVQVTQIDNEKQLQMARLELRDKLKRRMRGLRDEGLYPEAEQRKKSEYERMIQRMIANGIGRH